MNDLEKTVYETIATSKLTRDFTEEVEVTGDSPWDLTLKFRWKDVGLVKISSFNFTDFWAVRDWWLYSCNYQTKCLLPLFPSDERLNSCIANHFKNHEARRDIIFNAWLLKEGALNEDFDNEIIGHFYLLHCNSDKPLLGLGIASGFQGKRLGTLFIILIAHITKLLGKKYLWLSTGKDNVIGYNLYLKLGFQIVGDIEVYVPSESYKRIDTEMRLDLECFS
jgi:RimJ/RimL family protein N-acetyltransferase